MNLKIYWTTTTALILWSYISDTQCQLVHQKIGNCTFIIHSVCPNPSINFYLYTRQNVQKPQLVTIENITDSYFVKSLPNKFIMHGFNSRYKLDILQRMKYEYLQYADLNVWMIDYSTVSAGPKECYVAAVYNLPSVGRCAALFVSKIIELSEVNDRGDVMHAIGFSLGGQLASQLADYLKPYLLPWITGLDPALPLYYSAHLNKRLNRNDAKFVEVIHTNALEQGQIEPCGDIDFYVNGGVVQPACSNSKSPSSCNHHMAPVYFTESIRSTKGFWGWPCPSAFDYYSGKCPAKGDHQLMGNHVNKTAKGVYVLKTNSESPYAEGDWTF